MKIHIDGFGTEFWAESVGSGQWKIMGYIPMNDGMFVDELDTVTNCATEQDAVNNWIEKTTIDIAHLLDCP